MIKKYRHIALWMCSTLLLLFTACSSSDGDSEDNTSKEHQLQLNIYTPEHPVVTRGEMVNSNDDENVNTMDIWVFTSQTTTHIASGAYVGYVHVDVASPSSFEGGTYQMSVSEDFVNEHPNVNVYVAANVLSANTGITLTKNSTEAQLNAALLAGGYFGLTSPISTPSLDGLPMSGVLKNKVINTSRTPLLSVDDPVKVVRAVSKVRFIFSRTNTGEADELHINSISLENGTDSGIPEEEYLFLSGAYDDPLTSLYRIGENYLAAQTVASGLESTRIPTCTYPARYAYDPNNADQSTGQAYENLIDDGLTGHYTQGVYSKGEPFELVELKRFYLRESDKRLKGRIYYTIGNGGDGWPKYSEFEMTSGEIFSRNHTWIVYGYFTGKEILKVSCVNVTDWNQTTTDHPIHNW